MFVHFYNPQTGEYTASQMAMPDPMNAEGWLIPAFTTNIQPPERTRGTWPFFINGEWHLRPDFRGVVLYRRDTGEPAEILLPGITLDDAQLTDKPRPSDEYHWQDGDWAINPLAVAARVRREVTAELDTRFSKAREKNFGKGDAFVAGLLTPLQVALYKAWSAYQVALGNLAQSPDFPNITEWPAEPDEAAIAVQVEAELEAARIEAERAAEEQAAAEKARLPWNGEEPPAAPAASGEDQG